MAPWTSGLVCLWCTGIYAGKTDINIYLYVIYHLSVCWSVCLLVIYLSKHIYVNTHSYIYSNTKSWACTVNAEVGVPCSCAVFMDLCGFSDENRLERVKLIAVQTGAGEGPEHAVLERLERQTTKTHTRDPPSRILPTPRLRAPHSPRV